MRNAVTDKRQVLPCIGCERERNVVTGSGRTEIIDIVSIEVLKDPAPRTGVVVVDDVRKRLLICTRRRINPHINCE